MNTCEAIGTHACIVAATLGYFVFAAAVIFVAFASMRALLDLSFALDRFRASKRATLFGAGIAPCRRSLAVPATPGPVIAFASKTRNRLVVR